MKSFCYENSFDLVSLLTRVSETLQDFQDHTQRTAELRCRSSVVAEAEITVTQKR